MSEHDDAPAVQDDAPAEPSMDVGRRVAVERLLTLAAATPIAALLFDPRGTKAQSTDSGPILDP